VSGARVLVTGSTGLIGAPLLRLLRDRGFEAHGVSRTASTGALTHRADLTSAETTAALVEHARPSAVIHLAGGRESTLDGLRESNVVPTVNLLHAAARLVPPPLVITTGSAAEYGEPVNGIASESDAPRPVTEYGRAKVEASTIARSIADASDIRLCIVRPFNIVAPDLPSASALGNMRRQLLEETGTRRVVRCGRLDVVRDFVPIEFVLETFVRLLELYEWPDLMNVCSGVGIELGCVLHAMAAELDVEVDAIPVPELVAIPAADTIVGDATVLHALGLACEPTAVSLARVLLGNTS
jgi:nucleoside-diphosphate-sugar epimerase